MTGEIPSSNALAEANPESLTEFLSRDPFGYSEQDIARGVAEFRAARARWEAAGAVGGKRGGRAPAAVKPKINLDEIGLD